MRQKPFHSNRGFSTVDLVLLGLILVSIAFIAWKLLGLRSAKQAPRAVAVQTDVVTPPVPAQSEGKIEDPLQKAIERQDLIWRLSQVSTSDWEKLLTMPSLRPALIRETETCQFAPDRNHLNFISKKVIDAVLAKQTQSLVVHMARSCFRVGGQAQLVYHNFSDSGVATRDLGAIDVRAILQIGDGGGLAPEVYSLLKIDAESLKKITTVGQGAEAQFVILRVENLRPPSVEQSKRPPASVFRYPSFNARGVQRLKSSGVKIAVVDVRSEAEIADFAIPNAINVHYEVPDLPEKGRRYAPEISVEQLSKASFNVSELVESQKNAARTHYIVVGTDDFDGRPFWFTREMLKMGIANASYYPAGAESLAAALVD